MIEQTIRELALEHHEILPVFEKYGIDYCCHGNTTLELACAAKGIKSELITKELTDIEQAENYSSFAPHFRLWSLDFLVNFVVQNHHNYVRAVTPSLVERLTKVALKHADTKPQLKRAAKLFLDATNELEEHMRKEELILFPYIRLLFVAKQHGTVKPRAPFGTISNPISKMEAEHQLVGEIFKEIRELCNDFQTNQSMCGTQTGVMRGLEAFERDLHQHIYLESAIVFPAARRLEQELLLD